MQLVSVLEIAPPPELPLSVQLVRAHEIAPAPVLPVSVQLFSVLPVAPPPELPVSAQLFRRQLDAPLELAISTQLFSVPPSAPAEPFVRVNPVRMIPAPKLAHRFDRPPSIIVTAAPLMLRTDSAGLLLYAVIGA